MPMQDVRNTMIRPRTGIPVTALCVASAFLGSCGEREKERPRRLPREAGVIAFVGAGRDDAIWAALRAGAQRFDRESGRYEVRYEAPEIVSSDRQVALIHSLADPSLRGLCVQVIDPKGIVPALERARRSGARIITIGPRVIGTTVDGQVVNDEQQAGHALAEATRRAVGPGGAVMLLHNGDDDLVTRDRYRAYQDAIRTYPQVEVWADVDCGGSPATARSEIIDRSKRFPSVAAWVSIAAWPLMNWPRGTATAPSLPPGCRIVTCGAEPQVWPHIESGLCPYVVGFDYGEAGARAMEFCQVAIQATVPQSREYLIPVRIISAENLEDYKRDWTRWATPPPPP